MVVSGCQATLAYYLICKGIETFIGEDAYPSEERLIYYLSRRLSSFCLQGSSYLLRENLINKRGEK